MNPGGMWHVLSEDCPPTAGSEDWYGQVRPWLLLCAFSASSSTHMCSHAACSCYVMIFLSGKHCIGLYVFSIVWPTTCTKIILHECESPWPHATTTALQATWGRFPSAIVHIQMPCQCSLTWSSAYEVIFPKSLCRPWVISEVPVSPLFSSPIHSHVSSFSALALKLMTNEFCNTSRKLPQHSNNFLGQFTFFNEGWGVEVFLLF